MRYWSLRPSALTIPCRVARPSGGLVPGKSRHRLEGRSSSLPATYRELVGCLASGSIPSPASKTCFGGI
jgi:hypothetical protein